MATVLVNNDNSMIVTIPERIMQHSKNIHTITILFLRCMKDMI